MNIILTGVTGNLGFELALLLKKHHHTIIPIQRSLEASNKIPFEVQPIINDLLDDSPIIYKQKADLIIHSAGNVNFRKAENSNQLMTSKIIKLAQNLKVPLIYISTAYIYRPKDSKVPFNNQYEIDKYESEQRVISSGLKYSIFRPSVLVGNSKSGKIQNFSGYYNIAQTFNYALNEAKRQNKKIRFPKIHQKSNLVPADQAAQFIINKIEEKEYFDTQLYYVVNKNPPDSTFVLKKTIEFFELTDQLDLIEISFEKFAKLDLSVEEQYLYKFIKNYYPYWVFPFSFPTEDGLPNLITTDYLVKILTYLNKTSEFQS